MNNQYQTLSPKALRLMRITQGISLVFFLAICGALVVAMRTVPVVPYIISAAALVLSAAAWIAIPKFRFRRYKYLIEKDRIEIIEGVFFTSRTIVPIDRIHQLDIRTGPLDKFVGVAKVVVTTAGSSATFRFLEPERAQEVAMYLNNAVAQRLAVGKAEREGEQGLV